MPKQTIQVHDENGHKSKRKSDSTSPINIGKGHQPETNHQRENKPTSRAKDRQTKQDPQTGQQATQPLTTKLTTRSKDNQAITPRPAGRRHPRKYQQPGNMQQTNQGNIPRLTTKPTSRDKAAKILGAAPEENQKVTNIEPNHRPQHTNLSEPKHELRLKTKTNQISH